MIQTVLVQFPRERVLGNVRPDLLKVALVADDVLRSSPSARRALVEYRGLC
jgi:hypothetical protein